MERTFSHNIYILLLCYFFSLFYAIFYIFKLDIFIKTHIFEGENVTQL